MAFTPVQTNHANDSLASIAFPGSVTAGNLLIFAISYGSSETITSLAGCGTWAKIDGQTDAGNGQKGEWWWAVATSGTTITPSGTSFPLTAVGCVIAEFPGTDSGSPLDVHDGSKAFGTTSLTTDAETSNSITPAAAGELILAAIYDQSGTAPAFTAGTGWTVAVQEPGLAGADGACGLEYKTGAAGSQSATWTVNKSGDSYTVQIAAFKAAAIGGNVLHTPLPFMSNGRI